jgi:hypothetical protein
MAAFSELNWLRFDVWAIAGAGGIATVDINHQPACHAWLLRNEYVMDSINFGNGIGQAMVAFNTLFHWEEQFGYELHSESRNLDALRDGFNFDLKPGQGHVLELLNAEVAYRENKKWFCGFLAISREYSHHQLALGSKFFVILVLKHDSKLIGRQYDSESIQRPFWTGGNAGPFDN